MEFLQTAQILLARVRMPKIPSNFAPLETNTDTASSSALQMTAITDSTTTAPRNSEILIAATTTSQNAELQQPSTSAPMKALQQLLPKPTKRARKSPKF